MTNYMKLIITINHEIWGDFVGNILEISTLLSDYHIFNMKRFLDLLEHFVCDYTETVFGRCNHEILNLKTLEIKMCKCQEDYSRANPRGFTSCQHVNEMNLQLQDEMLK